MINGNNSLVDDDFKELTVEIERLIFEEESIRLLRQDKQAQLRKIMYEKRVKLLKLESPDRIIPSEEIEG
jgi:hypothetical protein